MADATPDTSPTVAPEPEVATTDDVVDFIIQTAKARSHKLLTRETAKAIYEGILLLAVEQVRQHGFFKLPYGYGHFYVRVLGMNAKPRRLPNGTMVDRRPKPVMRYKPGSTVQALLQGEVPKTNRHRKNMPPKPRNLRRSAVR